MASSLNARARFVVPSHTACFNPILKALRTLGGSASIEELNSRVAADMGLSDDVLAIPHDEEHGGQSEFAYRTAWARTYLKVAGLITNSERAVWSLTPEGMKVGHVDEKTLDAQVRAKRKGAKPRPRRKPHEAEREGGDEGLEGEEPGGDGEESGGWKHELLKTLHKMKPDAFERLAQRVLRESGFVEVKVTGRSGDRGIDGIGLLKLQGMLTFQVIFQCKRWSGAVPPSAVREFRGTMSGRTDKGLIIATTHFTPEAIREATRDGVPAIDLINGDELVVLLKKLRLGVKPEMVERVTIDHDWFSGI